MPNQTKLKCSLSVPQLALFFRILHDLKIIETTNQTDILKFIVNNFKTSKAENISIRSLQSKYYNLDTATTRTIQKLTSDMMKQINRLAKLE